MGDISEVGVPAGLSPVRIVPTRAQFPNRGKLFPRDTISSFVTIIIVFRFRSPLNYLVWVSAVIPVFPDLPSLFPSLKATCDAEIRECPFSGNTGKRELSPIFKSKTSWEQIWQKKTNLVGERIVFCKDKTFPAKLDPAFLWSMFAVNGGRTNADEKGKLVSHLWSASNSFLMKTHPISEMDDPAFRTSVVATIRSNCLSVPSSD